jgi:UDP-N-acetylmuramoylalanine--D-glutamate ligase
MCPRNCSRTFVRFSDLEGARIGVWGAGREITSFASQLARRLPTARIAVAGFDQPPLEDVATLLTSPGLVLVSGDGLLDALSSCDAVVRSPGVSIHRPEMIALRERGVTITTATALWLAEHGPQRVIGVTGTKGKSTTAALAHHLALAAGEPAQLAGNIGVPALDLLDAEEDRLTILELSSYQIADLTAGPELVIFTNLYPEHADWHGSTEAYRSEKLQILSLAEVRTAVLPARQPELAGTPTHAHRILFGTFAGWDLSDDGIRLEGEPRIDTRDLPLPGEHNALNLCAALAGLEAICIRPALPQALAGFRGLEHRLQTVAEEPGLTWVDDSISTTPESTLAALASFPGRPIVLLAGGQDRGQDYGELGRRLAALEATVIGLGSTGRRLLDAVLAAGAPATRVLAAADLQAGVALARERAGEGAVVLLSPAAPSYDDYRDFTERGARFRALVAAR